MNSANGIVTLTLNPAIDQSAAVPNFTAGEVNRVEWERSDPGGKGVNVASFLADLGHRVTVAGFLGRENSAVFERLFRDKSMDDRFLRVAGKTRVNVKIIDEVGHRITDINFPGQTVTAADLAALRQTVAALIPEHEWFVLSGSLPAGVPVDIYAELVATLKAAGKRVVLDTSGAPMAAALGSAPYAIKPNIAELEEVLGKRLPDRAAVVSAARSLLAGGVGCVVVSMGKDGALFVEGGECVLALPPAVQVKSTVGAGDAMVAGFVAARIAGSDLAQCARRATATAVGALSQLGPRLPPRADIEAIAQQVAIETVVP